MLESQMYLPPQGFGIGNRSLAGMPHATYRARLAMLGFVRVTLIFSLSGDQLTWGIMDDLDIPWGDNTVLLYEQSQQGWSYDWNVDLQTFTVTDDAGSVTKYEGVNSLSGLGISWEIMVSKQFHIYKTKVVIIEDSSLLGTRVDPRRISQSTKLAWMEIDYLPGTQHAAVDYLVGYTIEVPGKTPPMPIVTPDGLESLVGGILLARTDELNFKNYYPVNLHPTDSLGGSERLARELPGHLQANLSALMIMCFAARLLSAEAKMLYEPWMIYAMFQWMFQRRHDVKKESIFDLSPWWG